MSAEQAAQHFILSEGNSKRNLELATHIRNLWGGRDCAVRECEDCGFGFADPYVSGDATFYNLAYERSSYPGEKWEFERTIKELSSIEFHAERVLEAGAGFGYFIDKIVDTYVRRTGITALDYSNEAIRTLRSKGYIARQEDLRNADLVEGFDAIFLFQVVEHMDGLDELFDRISYLLREGGLLFIAVPNPKRIKFNEQNGSLLDVPPNHIGLWSPVAFQMLGARHRLRLDLHETEPFSLSGFIKEDIAYSYLRRSQRKGTMENWSRRLRSASYGKLIGAVFAALSAPRRVNIWRKAAASSDELGSSLWVKFTKMKSKGCQT
ncbi:class I SAM-dependent methyltransferase [Rhodomicrobium sp. Az07]|uniref:class I SAM-dependent methyltransferase n=1 Tax=Rhodomicrobium sp. Az07 TaxID=2839034 RepID=UPI001BEA40EC|nr:class I SAM-dependent methyltransferase [Rhodomicrobium sp. Az07]MBT3069806.1 class I SAM-dependent methyltransferase [Rhodomicrobium sp. Az07]